MRNGVPGLAVWPGARLGHNVSKAGALALVLIGACGACRDTNEGVRTQFVGSYAFSATERRTISRIAGLTAIEARRHLPALASPITLRVQSGKDVIPEIGATAEVAPPDWVVWTVDADRPEGVVKIAETHLRGALFHEFHHLVRGTANTYRTLMDRVITEGLATAFERVAPVGRLPKRRRDVGGGARDVAGDGRSRWLVLSSP